MYVSNIVSFFFQKERCPNVFVTEFGRVEGDHKNKGAIVEGLILIRRGFVFKTKLKKKLLHDSYA